jgi:hypothetical protein
LCGPDCLSNQTQKWVLGILISVFVLCAWAIIAAIFGHKTQTSSLENSQGVVATPSTPLEADEHTPRGVEIPRGNPAPLETAWNYSSVEDEMGRKVSTAIVTSSNTFSFGFPYAGEQHATLVLRKRGSDNVMLQIEKGQLTCGDYVNRGVNVRFDDRQPRRFGVSGTAYNRGFYPQRKVFYRRCEEGETNSDRSYSVPEWQSGIRLQYCGPGVVKEGFSPVLPSTYSTG